MQNVRKNGNGQRRAYLHFARSFPFPVNPVFFGQTFVIGNLTAATRYGNGCRNVVFTNCNGPLAETLLCEKGKRLAKERFNASLKHGYKVEALDEVTGFLKGLIDEGYHPTLLFHFAVSSDTVFANALSQELKRLGMRDRVGILFYLHTQADNIVHRRNTPSFERYYNEMVEASDGTISVGEAVRQSFIDASFPGSLSMDGDSAYVVRNGIDSHVYTPGTLEEVEEARDAIGISRDVEKLVAFCGRMDRIKGSDYLLSVLQHFDQSKDPKDSSVGFVIATPHIVNMDQTSRHFKGLARMQRLIREDRLKVVLDIAKFTRGDPRFRGLVQDILTDYARQCGFEKIESERIYGGMVNIPVQRIADVYVHPSRSEAMPLAVLEAVFSGAYVLATAVGGIPEIVSDTLLGRLFKPATNELPKQIAAAIRKVSSPRYINALFSVHLERFTDMHMFQQFERTISEVLQNKGGI